MKLHDAADVVDGLVENAVTARTTTPAATGTARDRLRIGLIAPPWFTVPPKGYGGTERIVAQLANGLVGRGHDVTLFAPRGSVTRASLVETFPEPMYRLLGSGAIETQNVMAAYRDWRCFDLVHDHTVAGLGVAPMVDRPVVHTVHGAVLPDIRGLYASLPPNVHLVAVSEHQRSTLPRPRSATLIRNTMDVTGVEWSQTPGEYLLFVGRASPQKGPLDALRIAERAGMPLRMLMKVSEAPEQEYFEFLRPHLNRPGVQVELEPPEAVKQRAYAAAYATLFPIAWDEPFGLVMIESMAGGTPVIGYRRASVPEIVVDGVTGIVCAGLEEAVAAVVRAGTIDREACRRRVETVFSTEAAVERHERLYRCLVAAYSC